MSANTQALCSSFKLELINGYHAFYLTVNRGSTAADIFKAALYFAGSSLGPATTVYNSTGEVGGAGVSGYSAGGIAVTNGTATQLSGTTAFWTPSAPLSWAGLTVPSNFDSILIYNSSQGNRAVAVLTFPAQTISAGTFTYNFPVNAATTATLQVT